MIGPKKAPKDFGFKSGDSHIIVNDIINTAKAYNFSGKLLWELPALARGQAADNVWQIPRSDTPPGLWKLTTPIVNDVARYGSKPREEQEFLRAYGWIFFPMMSLEGQETKFGRRGIGLHGGGSACGWPGAWLPMQTLYPTHGCVRMHNTHTRDNILPLFRSGTVFLSVYQES